jgi:hypothetical protein
MPQIIVDIAEAGARSEGDHPRPDDGGASRLRNALVTACSAAAGTATCVTTAPSDDSGLVVLVRWRTSTWVHIELSGSAGTSSAPVRDLAFESDTPIVERWRTAGYTVGVLGSEAIRMETARRADDGSTPAAATSADRAGATETKNATATVGADQTPAETPPPASPPNASSSQSGATSPTTETSRDGHASSSGHGGQWWFAGGGVLGPGLDTVRAGGFVRAGRAFGHPFATIGLVYSVDPADGKGLSAQRFSASAGGGYEVRLSRTFRLDVRVELFAELLSASVDDPSTHRTDTNGRLLPGLCVGADVAQTLAGAVALVGGIDAMVRTERTDIRIAREPAATAPAVDAQFTLGARVDVP